MSELVVPDPDQPRDPRITVVHTESTQNQRYQLVEVDQDAPVALVYRKPAVGLAFDITQMDSGLWRVVGITDPDIIQNLSLPVQHRRYRDEPPIIGADNLARMKANGRLERTDEYLYQTDLVVPGANILEFMSASWQPRLTADKIAELGRPIYCLRNEQTGMRRLPEKFPVDRYSRSGVLAVVIPE